MFLGTLFVAKLILDMSTQTKASNNAIDFRLYHVDFGDVGTF